MPSMVFLLWQTFLFCLRFLVGHPLAILKETALPGIGGCAALYLLLSGYCGQLLDYLGHPSDVVASRVLGIAAAGLLIMLFLHAIVVEVLAGIVLGQRRGRPAFLGVRATAWHIYTANLRLVMAMGAGGMVLWLVALALKRVWLLPESGMIKFILLVVVFCLCVRAWFFAAPACLIDKSAQPLATAWHRSAGNFWSIAIVMFAVFIGSIAFQAMGEVLLHGVGLLPPLPHPETFAGAVMLYRENLLPMVVLVSVTYLIAMIFLTAARIYLYERIAASAPPA